MNQKTIFLWLSLTIITGVAHAQFVRILQNYQHCSVRGLSVVSNKVVWLSGSNGYVAHSTNGGKTFQWQQISGFEKSDFRDIEGFSAKEAIMMSSGSPALILKTTNGGKNWKVVYRNNNKIYFLDALAFDNRRHGIVLGDPVNNQFFLLETFDRGQTWEKLNQLPDALPGEAAFAASGTCLLAAGKANNKEISIVTGGTVSRLIKRLNQQAWTFADLPITHGSASEGAFSIAAGAGRTIIIGGNYLNIKNTDSIACLQTGASTFLQAKHMPGGYQSCVTYIQGSIFLSTGTSGSNVSANSGRTWTQIDHGSYNVCQRAKHGKLILLAGDNGKIAILKTK